MATDNGAAHPVAMLIYGDDPKNRDLEKAFGVRFKAMRERRGLTQEQLAHACELAADTIRRAEHGHFAPSLRTLAKMASGLGVPTWALLRDDFDQADDLAECSRALPDREFRIAVAMVKVLSRLVAGLPSGEG